MAYPAPQVAQQEHCPPLSLQIALKDAGLKGPLADTITATFSTAAGIAVGGPAGAAGAFNEVANNYLSHQENEARYKARKACSETSGIVKACSTAAQLQMLDQQRDAAFHGACDGLLKTTPACAELTRDLYNMMYTYSESDA